MNTDTHDARFIDELAPLTLEQVCQLSQLSADEVRELVACGALPLADAGAPVWRFTARCVVTARSAWRLREELALDDIHSLAVALRLTQRIEQLQQELATLRGQR